MQNTNISPTQKTHLFNSIRRPVLPLKMQGAVFSVLEEDRAFRRVRIDEIGLLATETPACLESNSWFYHLEIT